MVYNAETVMVWAHFSRAHFHSATIMDLFVPPATFLGVRLFLATPPARLHGHEHRTATRVNLP